MDQFILRIDDVLITELIDTGGGSSPGRSFGQVIYNNNEKVFMKPVKE